MTYTSKSVGQNLCCFYRRLQLRINLNLILGLLFLLGSYSTFANGAVKKGETEKDHSLQSETPTIPMLQYGAGGVVGSVFGLGTGHAIQGRYTKLGWIFTLSEVATLTLGLWGALNSTPYFNRDGYNNSIYGVSSYVGFFGFFSLRIWEIVDLWTGVSPTSSTKSHALVLVPNPHGPQVAFSWNF